MPESQEQLILKAIGFLDKCDKDFEAGIFSLENAEEAASHLRKLRRVKKSNLVNALLNKLDFVSKQITSHQSNSHEEAAILNLVPLSVSEYIINLVKERRLTNRELIARFVYLELCKVLYYDISYVRQPSHDMKRKICEAPIDVKKAKIFSYVVCTQWAKLYKHILGNFGIEVQERSIPGQDHVWAEVKLNDKEIIIADATEYINSSIDLSNAKTNAPTIGFIVLPKEFSGLKLYDVFAGRDKDLKALISSYYDHNRDLDIDLGYIESREYPIERMIRENELFNSPRIDLRSEDVLGDFCEASFDFLRKLPIPANVDGYELFAYYDKFIRHLPRAVAANVSQKTLYVDSFFYNQRQRKKKLFQTPDEYLVYLERLVYDRYYRFLEGDEKNAILEQFQSGAIDGAEVSRSIADYEMQVAELNRNINLYYAINKLQAYRPYAGDTIGIQLYEPMMGKKMFTEVDDYNVFAKKIKL